MYKALVIGCGNIGAGYDLNNAHIQTHAKAYYLHPDFQLNVYDTNHSLARKASEKYNCNIAANISKENLSTFDCVSICTPTNTHIAILNDTIAAGVKLIICEKPVSYDICELDIITDLYYKGRSKILVNYIRRFQPAYYELRNFVSILQKIEQLSNISIRYQRGFINNCSHAFDLIEYLTGKTIELTEIKKHNVVNDRFDIDPTLSLLAKWDKVNIDIAGLTNVQFSHFEIDLFFEMHKISFSEAGNTINVYKAEQGTHNLQPLVKLKDNSRQNCIKDYMKYVIDEAHSFLMQKSSRDNFMTSVKLNRSMLNYLLL